MNCRPWMKTCLSLILALPLISCTFGPTPLPSGTGNVQRLLLEAGFVRTPADSAEKLDRVRSEVQRKVIPIEEKGRTYYLYADADYCQCLYVGTESAFQRFEDLLAREQLRRDSCIDDRLRKGQDEPWREFGTLQSLCADR